MEFTGIVERFVGTYGIIKPSEYGNGRKDVLFEKKEHNFNLGDKVIFKKKLHNGRIYAIDLRKI